MKTWQHIFLGILIGILAIIVIYIAAMIPRGEPLVLSQPSTQSPMNVYVTGAVKNPGVYTLSRESRANDAITAAGGFSEDADESIINLAAKVRDGEKIFVPSIMDKDDNDNSGSYEHDLTSNQGIININVATQEELEVLPGIGPSRAREIINYREENGDFQQIEEIQNVPGIGAGIFDQLKDFITIDFTP